MSEGKHIDLSVVIPAYNEEKNLPDTVRDVADVLSRRAWTFEIVVVDDASTDGTARVAESLAESDRRVVASANRRNLGMARAFLRGVEAARGDWVMLIPADLAVRPDQIPGFMEAAGRADVVLGIRANRDDYSTVRALVSRVNIFLVRTLFRMPQRQFNFVALYRRAIFDSFEVVSGSHFFHAEILIRARDAGFTIEEREAENVPRRFGETSAGSPGAVARALRDLLAFWWSWRWAGPRGTR